MVVFRSILTRCVVAIVAVMTASGCMVMKSSVDGDEVLSAERINRLHRERTTRMQLLQLLGPPQAALHPGETATVPSAKATEELSYDLAFLPFVDKHKPGPEHAVFYYQSVEASNLGVVVVFAGTSQTKIQRKRLWVLVNEEQGLVIDYVFRED